MVKPNPDKVDLMEWRQVLHYYYCYYYYYYYYYHHYYYYYYYYYYYIYCHNTVLKLKSKGSPFGS